MRIPVLIGVLAAAVPLGAQTPLTITTASQLPSATQGAAYSVTFNATGGPTPFAWSGRGFPPGLSLNNSTGALGGTPTAAGPYSFTIFVNDATGQQASKPFAMTVNPPVSITTKSLPSVTAGVNYNASLSATGGTPPYSWSVVGGNFPQGLSLGSGGRPWGRL